MNYRVWFKVKRLLYKVYTALSVGKEKARKWVNKCMCIGMVSKRDLNKQDVAA